MRLIIISLIFYGLFLEKMLVWLTDAGNNVPWLGI